MPRLIFAHPLLFAVLAIGVVGTTPAADAPRLPWADPIGVPPTFGTARPRLPYAEPIGASRLNPLSRAPLARSQPRPLPSRACHRIRDNRGNVATYCRTLR